MANTTNKTIIGSSDIPADGYILAYNAAEERWTARTPSFGPVGPTGPAGPARRAPASVAAARPEASGVQGWRCR